MYAESVETLTSESEVCCEPFHPEQWDNIRHLWSDKLFLKDSVPEIFHIPIPGSYAKTIARMWNTAEAAGAAPDRKDFLLLAHDPSAFKAELYMSITKEIKGADTVRMTGEFFSRVYEASYRDVPKCLRKTDEYLASKSMISKKYYINFPYCPTCAKKYGHNYVVVLAECEPI